ncbi:4HB MCP domain containing protein [Burkholderia sp. lig30]|uniref:MCP four helix bundle domain-containing protein n=1 Tax=Burkholderia sp. lig30 TaxID=1192124 RepID=UPI0004610DEC|nr:MCP four helix bundle domain-containing protein [Burkholderia sp. lig30]KDB06301.1 4HB MCP domain containing protein [Burkholderia sp. lig30]
MECDGGSSRFINIGNLNDELIESDWVNAQAANAIDSTMRSNARRTLELIVTSEQDRKDQVFRKIAENKDRVNGNVQTLEKLIRAQQGKTLLSQLKQARAQYVESFTKVGQMDEVTQQNAAWVEEAAPHAGRRAHAATRLRPECFAV